MRIVARGHDAVGAREIDREPDSKRIEVHSIVIELPQILAWPALDVDATIRECLPPAIESLGEIRNRAAEMTQYPFDVRIPFRNACEHELGCREGRVG